MRPESASPVRGCARSTNAALKGSGVVAASGSGHSPFTRRQSSDRKRVSRKNTPCGKPPSMSPEVAEIENAGPSTRVMAPPSPPMDALADIVHGCDIVRHGSGVPFRAVQRSLLVSAAMKIAQIAPPWFAVPPTGYGGIELVVAILADGLAERGHDVTLFASGGSRTKANLVSPLADPPDPALLGNVWFDTYHATASYLEITDEFDVVHDHSGIIGPGMGALRAGRPPVVHTLHGPWTEPSRRFYALLAEHLHIVAISESQRADNPDIPYAGVVHNGIDLDGYPFRETRTTSSSTSGAPTPTRARRSRSKSPGAPASARRW